MFSEIPSRIYLQYDVLHCCSLRAMLSNIVSYRVRVKLHIIYTLHTTVAYILLQYINLHGHKEEKKKRKSLIYLLNIEYIAVYIH